MKPLNNWVYPVIFILGATISFTGVQSVVYARSLPLVRLTNENNKVEPVVNKTFTLLAKGVIPEKGKNNTQTPIEGKKPSQSQPPLESFGGMLEEMYQINLNALTKPATAEKLATFTRNYYEALIKKGFSPQEALDIVVQSYPLSN